MNNELTTGLAVKGSEIKKNIMDAINSLSRIG